MGFRAVETMSRYVFPAAGSDGLLDGLEPTDLINWRGSPDLLPEYKAARSHDIQHAPKWTNRHAVASDVLEIPHGVGFRPLLVAEFDLGYTPLLEWHYGRGTVLFSSLDFTGRVGRDPAATRLASNLLLAATAPRTPTRRTYCAGDGRARRLLDTLGVAVESKLDLSSPETSLLVVAPGDGAPDAETLDRFAEAGGNVVFLPQDRAQLTEGGCTSYTSLLHRVALPDTPIFRGVGRDLLRWRDGIPVEVITAADPALGIQICGSGAFTVRSPGRGIVLSVQIDPFALDERYQDTTPEYEAIQLSRVRLRQQWSRLLTQAGAASAEAVAARLTTLKAGASYRTLGQWSVLGPFFPDDEMAAPGTVLDTEFPGEAAAVAGDTNPNTIYVRRDGKRLDFRTMVQADTTEYVNLSAALEADNRAVAYLTRTITREHGGAAVLRLGIDYWMKAWVNGELVYRMDQGHGSPKPNRHLVKVNLRPGENVITLKVMAGTKGFGVWANLAESDEQGERAAGRPSRDAQLYDPAIQLRDPYEYAYW